MNNINFKRKQVGGAHYKKFSYEIWDFVEDTKLGFVIGSAIKYLLRNKENRLIDLEKAIHCLEKAVQLNISVWTASDHFDFHVCKFIKQFENERESIILLYIIAGEYEDAIKEIEKLMEKIDK